MKQPRHSPKEKKDRSRHLTATSRLLIGGIPFVLFLIGLTVLSIGVFRYIENESVLSLFLVDRGRVVSVSSNTPKWPDSQPTVTPIATSIPDPSEIPKETPRPINTPKPTPIEPERLIVPFYYIGDLIGTISIPSVNVEVGVYQGDREAEFRLGAGHYPGSYFPGQGNNILIAAHRTTYFKNLETLEVGDSIHFLTTYGLYNYIVEEIRIIDGDDNSVANETAKEQLTLYTCYPFRFFGNAPNRFVVIAGLAED